MKLGLENIRRSCAALGHPERAYPLDHRRRHQRQGIGHRDGRRGAPRRRPPHRRATPRRTSCASRSASSSTARKSTPAALEAAAAHVQRVRRIAGRVGRAGGPADLLRVHDRDRASSCSATARVDVAVLEVGLGGRLDATNVVAADRRRDHVDRLRSRAVARRHAGRRSRPRRPASSSRASRWSCGPLPAEAARGAIAPRLRGARGRVARFDDRRPTRALDRARARAMPLGARAARIRVDNAVVAVRLLEAIDATVAAFAVGPDGDWRRRSTTAALAGAARVDLRAATAASPARRARTTRPARARWRPTCARPHAGGVPLVFGAMRDKDVREMLDGAGAGGDLDRVRDGAEPARRWRPASWPRWPARSVCAREAVADPIDGGRACAARWSRHGRGGRIDLPDRTGPRVAGAVIFFADPRAPPDRRDPLDTMAAYSSSSSLSSRSRA